MGIDAPLRIIACIVCSHAADNIPRHTKQQSSDAIVYFLVHEFKERRRPEKPTVNRAAKGIYHAYMPLVVARAIDGWALQYPGYPLCSNY